MRDFYIAGNWKMHKDACSTEEFIGNLAEYLDSYKLNGVEVIICPPSLFVLQAVTLAEETQIRIGGQNISEYLQGAYTGEISAPMLESVMANYCIIGHSERRKMYNDTNEVVNQKLNQLLDVNLTPIVCIGETIEQREAGKTEEVLAQQLQGSLAGFEPRFPGQILLAYEPVWAIGTGNTATPELAQQTHSFIRSWLVQNWGQQAADDTPILYGGSVKPDNIDALLRQADIDGGLIGGASLEAESFIKMIEIAQNIKNEE